MIIRARAVVTMDGGAIDNGAVAVAENKIADVGAWPEVSARNSGRVVDLGERVLLPGLINAHCHLDYTVLRGRIAPQASFAEWIEAINAEKASLTPDDYLCSIQSGFAEAARFGTTTIANLEAFPELLGRMETPPLRTWWFGEMIDVRAPVALSSICEQLAVARGKKWPGGIGLAPHAPYSASQKLYAEAAAAAAQHALPLTTHVAESREEMMMFRDGSGALYDFMTRIGRPMDDCGTTTPLGLLIRRGVLDRRWIVGHLNELSDDDFRQLESAPKFHIVHCPRSHAYFGHARFAMPKLRSLGLNICLGTDSLASNSDLSLFSEMRQLAGAEPSISAREILEMATVKGAAALGQEQALGRLRRGYFADAIALPFTGGLRDIFEEIVSFDGIVPWILVDGQELERT